MDVKGPNFECYLHADGSVNDDAGMEKFGVTQNV